MQDHKLCGEVLTGPGLGVKRGSAIGTRRRGFVVGNSRKKRSGRSLDASQSVVVSTYEVTDEPILDAAYHRLPDHVRRPSRNYIARRKFALGVRLANLRRSWRNIHDSASSTIISLSLIRRLAKAKKWKRLRRLVYKPILALVYTLELCRVCCLQRKEYAKVEEILDHKFNLQLLYPKRKRFDIHRSRRLHGRGRSLLLKTQRRDLAQQYYDVLQKLTPTIL